jgi:hypothetical protein
LGAVWNHYRRAAPDVNIFNFFYGRTVLDGWICPKTRPGGARGRTRRPRPGGHIGDSIYRKFKKRRKFPARARRARGARIFIFF